MLAVAPLGVRLFRNQRYKGPIVRNGQVTGSFADCGLCDGASDLVGWRSVLITPEMVGARIAQMVVIECKTATGVASDAQKRFVATVRAAGGVAGFARSAEDAKKLLSE